MQKFRPRFSLFGVLLLTGALCAPDAHALVINQNDPALYSATLAPPPDDPGWNNVGYLNGASGVYIGNGYVLTASHVGAGTINLAGQNYNYDGQGVTRLQNPSTNSATDLVMFHLDSMPTIAALAINSDANLPDDQPFVMIGNGTERGAAQTDGFSYGGNSGKRWGTNTLGTYYDLPVSQYPYGDVRSIVMDFSQNPDATAMAGLNPVNEAQVAGGDSGGALFSKDGAGNWQLSGILFAKGRDDMVMTATDAAYGDYTFAADLATYRSQIIAVTAVPEPSTWLLMGAGLVVVLAARRKPERTFVRSRRVVTVGNNRTEFDI